MVYRLHKTETAMPSAREHVKVVIPWREDESRLPGFNWVCEYYKHRFGPNCLCISPSPEGPFNRAAAINAGVRQFPGHTVFIADADCFLCDHAINRSVEEVPDDKVLIPHSYFVPGNVRQKRKLINEQDPKELVRANWWRTRRKLRYKAPAGIWVVNADFFLEDPLDERFVGWGCEDTEFLTRVPFTRLPGPLYHIVHKRPNEKYVKRNKRLKARLVRSRRENRNQ